MTVTGSICLTESVTYPICKEFMKYSIWWIAVVIFLLSPIDLVAQGPPITSDKPIMLGANSIVVKTLTEIRNTEFGTFSKIPLMIHYLPSSNTLVGIYTPLVQYQFDGVSIDPTGETLGDIELVGKYQFYRKDNTGKTFRMVAKTIQTLPTGKNFGLDGISTRTYQSYVGMVAGYESIKYGISNELGFNWSPENDRDEFRYKLGFGLPLLKPTYPVKQINLYFEYQNNWFIEANEYALLYAQGIQYAKGRLTLETAIQLPLILLVMIVELISGM